MEDMNSVDNSGLLIVKYLESVDKIKDADWKRASAFAGASIIISEYPEIWTHIKEMFGGDSDE